MRDALPHFRAKAVIVFSSVIKNVEYFQNSVKIFFIKVVISNFINKIGDPDSAIIKEVQKFIVVSFQVPFF